MSKKAEEYEAALRPLLGSPQAGRLTTLGCPDCRGVLSIVELGKNGYLRFACQIGHVFSPQALVETKHTQLEDSLWCAAETANELMQLCTALSSRESIAGFSEEADQFKERSEVAGKMVAQLYALLQERSPRGQE